MIYLDYSANTPADSRVLERFCEVERSCPGNANSRHQAGRDAKLVIDHATQTIAGLLSAQPAEVIYTSGAARPTTLPSRGWQNSPAMWAGTSSPPRWNTRPSAAP